MTMKEPEHTDPYLDAVKRVEIGVSHPGMISVGDAALASIAISLRRIADALCRRGDGVEAEMKEEGKRYG